MDNENTENTKETLLACTENMLHLGQGMLYSTTLHFYEHSAIQKKKREITKPEW